MQKRRGEIIKVADLFEKYKTRFKPPQSSVIKEVIEVIEDITSFKLKPEQLKYSVHTRVVSLAVPGILKQEILLKQDEILIHLKARLGEHNAPSLLR